MLIVTRFLSTCFKLNEILYKFFLCKNLISWIHILKLWSAQPLIAKILIADKV